MNNSYAGTRLLKLTIALLCSAQKITYNTFIISKIKPLILAHYNYIYNAIVTVLLELLTALLEYFRIHQILMNCALSSQNVASTLKSLLRGYSDIARPLD